MKEVCMSSRGDWMKDLEERTMKAFLNSKQMIYVRKCPALQVVQNQRNIMYTSLKTESGTR